eukprot:COSAG01_NODE_1807_length_9189_cov_24.677778_10_plen_117_part_00
MSRCVTRGNAHSLQGFQRRDAMLCSVFRVLQCIARCRVRATSISSCMAEGETTTSDMLASTDTRTAEQLVFSGGGIDQNKKTPAPAQHRSKHTYVDEHHAIWRLLFLDSNPQGSQC